MKNESMLSKDNLWLTITGLALLGSVAIVSLASEQNTTAERWLIGGLLGAFLLVHLWMPIPNPSLKHSTQRIYLHLGSLTLIVVLAIVLLQTSFFTVLFFLISVTAMILLPTQQGIAWIILFSVITAIAYMMEQGWADGLMSSLVNGAAFVFFGMFGQALIRAENARRESQRLLQELQEAHQQLQAYADQVETLAVAEERNRLSRDLHDTLGHRLTASIVQLEGAARLVKDNPAKAGEIITTVRGQLHDGLGEVRRTVAMLRTPRTTDLSLPKALQQLAAGLSGSNDLIIETIIPDTLPPLPDSHRLALYRAAQEGLTNIQRHAQAKHAWLTLKVTPEMLSLNLDDDGIGVPLGAESNGFGLRGMGERAIQLGGKVAYLPRPEGGTNLVFQIPNPAAVTTPTP